LKQARNAGNHLLVGRLARSTRVGDILEVRVTISFDWEIRVKNPVGKANMEIGPELRRFIQGTVAFVQRTLEW
jgi:hypothetical protein